MTALVWLRRDLRLTDQAALAAALASGLPLTVLYIHEPESIQGDWAEGAAARVWLKRSLAALDQDLRARGGRLLLRMGDAASVLAQLVAQLNVSQLYWHRLYEPYAVQRDKAIKASLLAQGVKVESFPGYMLNEPWQVKTNVGEVYRVFSPYWRNAVQRLQPQDVLAAPNQIVNAKTKDGKLPKSLTLARLRLSARPKKANWDQHFWQHFQPGEAGAQKMLQCFADGAMASYRQSRDRPDQIGTSRLAAHIHFGEISVNQVLNALLPQKTASNAEHVDAYVRELGWRDFSLQLLFHFPHITTEPLNPRFKGFSWAEENTLTRQHLHAWQRGQTGIPIIDAGMRELWQTGWMHNRVRMIVASFLTKNLRLHWLHGAKWFWNTLLDADLANNTQGWQWSAGCGADAAPYFRIFNPVSQGEKFDPQGDYVRRYVPELAHLSAGVIHQPWKIGGVKAYPAPIVDLKTTREAALAAYAKSRAELGVGRMSDDEADTPA